MSGVTAVPASFGQQRLWFFDQLTARQAGDPLYNVHSGHVLRGPLDHAVLERALNTVVERHEVLRTTLRSVDGVPMQVIAPRLWVPTTVTDLGHVPADERHAEALRRGAEQAREPFDLATGPLLRSELLRFSQTDHVWLLTLHHAVCDAWSVGVLLREVTASYRGRTLDPLPLQYADFAVWQRGLVDGPRWRGDLDHWTRHLDGAPALLELPTDRPRPATQSFRGDLAELVLPAALRDRVATFARAERTTPFSALLTAFDILLHRYTGATDLVVGTAAAGRGRVELDGLIGLFANTLALRSTVDGRLGFRDLLRGVSEAVRDGQSHGDLPFERVVEVLAPDRQPSFNPVFQVMLDVQPGGSSALDLPGVVAEPLPVRDRRISLFDLSVSVADEPDGLRLVCEYATDLFDDATATRLLRCFATLLDAAVTDPDRPVRELSILADADRAHAMAAAVGSPAVGSPTVQALIADRIADRPDALAVLDVATGERLSYADLGHRVAALAGRLRAIGVGRDTLVGLFVDRSPAAVVGMLAVLEAGGAYLPLDPAYPADRLAAMLADADPIAVLTTDTLAPRLPTASRLVIPFDADTHRTVDPPDRDTPAQRAETGPHDRDTPAQRAGGAHDGVLADELAYVMFTSGSTGRPKGVMVRHGALAAYAAADRAAYALGPDDRVLQFSPLSFDVSAEEIFPCLTAGAALVLRSDAMLDSAEDFLTGCERHGVTVLHLPSAYFHELAPAGGHAGAGLRAVAIGGEAANPARVAQWQRLAPHARLVNVYGPTETTIVATMAPLRDDGAVPIGHPIPGIRVYLLDGELEPVPAGVPGELHIGGAGQARGYLNDPVATAQRFVPDPYGEPGARLYRTGDLGRLLPDGAIDFVGRTDGQLKIRGYRVEPGEIEAALTGLDAVREAAVVAREGAGGHPVLVAYVVAADGHRPDSALLRDGLAGRLPAFMVPSAFVVLDALPRTSNDKLDRAALPEPGPTNGNANGSTNGNTGGNTDRDDGFVTPVTEAERLVADVWREVLKVERVGAGDNFFAIGGHSLLAIQVVSRLRRTLGHPVGLRELFERPTLGEFAAALPGPRSPLDPGDQRNPTEPTSPTDQEGPTDHRGLTDHRGPSDRRPEPPPLVRAATGSATLAHLPAGVDDLLRELDVR